MARKTVAVTITPEVATWAQRHAAELSAQRGKPVSVSSVYQTALEKYQAQVARDTAERLIQLGTAFPIETPMKREG